MVKSAYRDLPRFSYETKKLLSEVIPVVERYGKQGYRLTLRQLYYQLVVLNVFANKQNNYRKLGLALVKARMCGLVDWEFIEDRIRVPSFPNEFSGIPGAVKALIDSYRLDRWEGQDEYVEVWVEKDALSGVLAPITSDYHVRLLVNRGYSSISAMHDAALRIRGYGMAHSKQCTILYFGDHDPSGEDMVRDIDARLEEFGCQVTIDKVALTMKQVEEYKLPPNPAKRTDPRAGVNEDGSIRPGSYIDKHGDESWELDALPPEVLNDLLTSALDTHLYRPDFDEVVEQEETDKKTLKRFADEQQKNEDEDTKGD